MPWIASSTSVAVCLAVVACLVSPVAADEPARRQHDARPTVGSIERLDPRLDRILAVDTPIEVLAMGFAWAEGPVWVPDADEGAPHTPGGLPAGGLLFSDIPANRILSWRPGHGLEVFLAPAGFTGPGGYGNEPGSNGLALDREGRLVICEHGDRRVSRLEPGGGRRTLADAWQGRRLNSPNDLVVHSSGAIYFTDPPYGLPQQLDDPRAELDFCGVYRIAPDGSLDLLCRTMTRPNGIGLSPDETTLYVAQSDPAAAVWRAFTMLPDGTLADGATGGRVFFDATGLVASRRGLPDGLVVDSTGTIFATGPGGVLVFDPDGTHLGTIMTGQHTANCCLGDDGRTLYITADSLLCRVRLK
jgi:gluconolactonase